MRLRLEMTFYFMLLRELTFFSVEKNWNVTTAETFLLKTRPVVLNWWSLKTIIMFSLIIKSLPKFIPQRYKKKKKTQLTFYHV